MVAESWIFPKDWYYLNSYILPSFYHEISNYKFIEKVIHFSTPEVYGSNKKKLKKQICSIQALLMVCRELQLIRRAIYCLNRKNFQ